MAKLLVVDDDYIVLDLLKDTLSIEGYDVITASNGLDGIEQLIKEEPSLVLLDIMMANIDGYEICKKIKECPSTAGIPIIFVSAKAMPEDRELGLSMGADDYITKPFDTRDLIARIKEILNKYGKS